MTKQRDGQQRSASQLREEAERRLVKASKAVPTQTAEELLHELQVHQIELEMQNESLRQSQQVLEESRDRYVDLYEFAPVGYLTLAANGQITGINLTGAALLGLERKRLMQRRFDRYIGVQDRERWNQLFSTAMAEPVHQQAELALQRSDGEGFLVSLDCVRTGSADTETMLRVALTDISERRHLEEELRIAAIAFESQLGMIVTDPRGIIIRVNHAFSELTGFAASEVVGHPPPLLKSARQDKAFYRQILNELQTKKYWQGEIWSRSRAGSVYAAWLTVTAVSGPEGEITHYVAAFSDITINKEAEAEIHRLAFYDPLTKLPNRRLLYDRLHQAMATSGRNLRHGALLFIDLDNFKKLNDTRGHDVGDRWLIEVARRLQAHVREGDTVARLGGDEFVVMLEGLSIKPNEAAVQAGLMGDTLRETLAEPYDLGVVEYHGGTSIGVSLFRNHEVTVDALLKYADLALYQAKSAGRNSVRFFDPAMQHALEERNLLESELRQALKRKQLKLYYQAQIDDSRRIVGAEVLLRWEHPKRGLMPPADFIQLAEEAGLMQPIGRWVLQTACASLKSWQQHPALRHLSLAVDVSRAQLRQQGFVDEVRAIMDETGAASHQVRLELTESSILDDVDDTLAKMHALKVLGISFAMDDFGTGYSSLSYLQRLPLDQLKIDGSFVSNLTSDANSAAFVKTIITLGRIMALNVIAEGVESEEQFECLREHGCGTFQGYLFSRPLPLSEFETFVQNNRP